ncbi:unnamed protein product [Allacma fusca]|uniref:Uncharacterized protein n=1 Tax=Allacma fusca TaxID=39272 RepID=A0A8J2PL89_9HEXA|nr:unnamed protein product [Allacma fusca]
MNPIAYIFPVVVIFLGAGPGMCEMCEFESCLFIYNNIKGLMEDSARDVNTLCSLQQELKDCNKKLARKCRGDLNYHFFEKLVRDLMNGSARKEGLSKLCSGLRAPSSSEQGNKSGPGNPSGRDLSKTFPTVPVIDKCAPKIRTDAFVGCALYGLTNLKSFSETLNYTDINYCSLSGAWSLIDTPEFAVQITNKGGLRPLPKDITTTTLVTVIIKSNQCSERKTYQATFDEVPGMFSDGYTTAGNVYIETIKESEHVKIHFPYLLATIDIIKVVDRLPIPSLSVTIRMPQVQVNSFVNDPARLRGLPLCFYGCPKTATMKPRSAETTASLCANYDSSSSSTVSEFPSGGSSGGNTINAAICASYKSVQSILSQSTVAEHKLAFPGEGNFGSSSSENPAEQYHVENSALTSQSPVRKRAGFYFG